MIGALLSGDLPRSRVLSGVLVVILARLALAPFLFPGAQAHQHGGQDLRLHRAGGEL